MKIIRNAIVMLLLGCASVQAVEVRSNALGGDGPISLDQVEIRLSRTACLGECPVYSVLIRGDGTVVFDGEQWVASPGHRETRIPVDAVVELINAAIDARFFSAASAYTERTAFMLTGDGRLERRTESVFDAASVVLEFRVGQVRKRVVLESVAPAHLRALAQTVEEVSGVLAWVR